MRTLEHERPEVGDGAASPTTANFVIHETTCASEHHCSTMVHEHSTTAARGAAFVAHHRVFVEDGGIREVHLLIERRMQVIRMVGNHQQASSAGSILHGDGTAASRDVEKEQRDSQVDQS